MQMSKRARTPEAGSCCSGLVTLLSPKLFKALADPKRVSLLVRMAEQREPCTVGRVARGSDIDMSVVSRHLAILRDAGIIECRKRGKEVWCSVQTGMLAQLLRDLAAALDACCPAGACPSAAPPRRSASPSARRRS